VSVSRIDESRVDDALVRICDADGRTRGTGFSIGDGWILTCHHVVDGLESVAVRLEDGVAAAVADEPGLRALDIALLQCRAATLDSILALALEPLAAPSVWTKGFQYAELMPEAVPLAGTIAGRTAITYTARQSYELEGVLALGDLIVGAGTSGAPLFDREWGVVVAVVNTRFALPGGLSGFAMPLRNIAHASELIRSLVERNRRTVPAYGPYLNVAAARATCDAALRAAMDHLVDRELLLPDKYCARPSTAAVIDEFVAGRNKILSIVGRSGTGKTTELAALAGRESGLRPILLVSCSELDGPPEEGIVGSLDRMLVRAAPDTARLDSALAALEADDTELLILLDALNEVPAQIAANERSWLAATFDWLRAHRVRIVMTCRPDHWDLISRMFPGDLLPQESPAMMDDFSQTEATEALRQYELTDRGLDPDDVRHPLLARIYWQLGRPSAKLNRYDALAEFADRLCADAALDAGLPMSSVRAVLSEVARRTAADAVLELRIDDVVSLDGPALQALVRHNVLLDAPAGLRFAFDELGEWQQAQHVAAGALGSARTGTSVFALLRLEREEGTTSVAAALDLLMASVPSDDDVSSIDFVLEQLVEELDDPAPMDPVLRRWIDDIVANRPSADFLAARTLGRAELPLERRFDLLRRLAAREEEYPWRHKRWRDLPELGMFTTAGSVAAELLRDDPVSSVDCLVRWFEDDTHLPGCASPSYVARGLLLHYCDLAFENICEAVAARGKDEVPYLFELTEAAPEKMSRVCSRWCASEDAQQRLLGGACARRLVGSAGASAAARDAARLALKNVLDREDPSARLEALAGLYADDETRHLVLTEVLDAFRRGGSPLSAYTIASGLRTNREEVFDTILGVIADRNRSDRGDTLQALGLQRLRPGDLKRLENIPNDEWTHEPLSWDLGRWLEDTLYRLDLDDPIAEALLTVTRRAVADGDEKLRVCVAYAATSNDSWGRDLFARLLAAAPGEERSRLVGEVAQEAREHPWIADVLLDWADRVDAENLDLRLLRRARRPLEPFGEELAAALRRRETVPVSRRLQEFERLVHDGVPPAEAADQALERGPASHR
jgi:hypothetical protein